MYEYNWEKTLESKINRDNEGYKDGENLREAVLINSIESSLSNGLEFLKHWRRILIHVIYPS